MKKHKKLTGSFFLGLILLSTACSSTPTTTETDAPQQAPTPAPTETAPIDAHADSTATLTIPAGDSAVTMLGELKTVQQEMLVRVPVQGRHQLTATLLPPDSLPNIRFAQVIRPDGQAKGPLDKTVSIPTPQDGTYTLRITHNLHTEAPLTKEFMLRVMLQ